MTSNGSYVKALLTEMAACLCNQIEAEGLTKPCWCGVVPGAAVVADFMPDCFGDEGSPLDGMAWVRLVSAYPAFQPGIVVENPADAMFAGLGFDIEMGILRSIPLSEDGIDEATAATSVTDQMDDMLCIRKAVMCCAELDRADFLLNQYTPVGPLGGVVGGAFTVMVHKP
jgi:hypothetical protein